MYIYIDIYIYICIYIYIYIYYRVYTVHHKPDCQSWEELREAKRKSQQAEERGQRLKALEDRVAPPGY